MIQQRQNLKSMIKCFLLPTTLSVVLSPFMTEVTFSRPVFSDSQHPKVRNSEVDLPLCYIQTADGSTFNLHKLCNKNSPVPIKASQARRIPKQIFRRGSGNAYASDSK